MILTEDFKTYDRRPACLPACSCGPTYRKLVNHRMHGTGNLRYRLVCTACRTWGSKAVPTKFVERTTSASPATVAARMHK